jgi:hypothetical protein
LRLIGSADESLTGRKSGRRSQRVEHAPNALALHVAQVIVKRHEGERHLQRPELRALRHCFRIDTKAPTGAHDRRLKTMPLYMDHHKNAEVLLAEAVAGADLETEHWHGAKALRYWFNEENGEVFCLFDAPTAEAAEAVRREAHGLMTNEIIEVEEGAQRGKAAWDKVKGLVPGHQPVSISAFQVLVFAYAPVNFASRFSKNAATPSLWSWV